VLFKSMEAKRNRQPSGPSQHAQTPQLAAYGRERAEYPASDWINLPITRPVWKIGLNVNGATIYRCFTASDARIRLKRLSSSLTPLTRADATHTTA
jgi:hypothetical protein